MKPRKRAKDSRNPSSHPPYTPVEMKFFLLPNPFGELSREERLEVVRKIGREANVQFHELMPRVTEWFERYDAPYILSFCAVYFLTSPEGVDPEAIQGKLDFYHHYLELLQAFALTKERSYSPEPLRERAQELQKFMQELGQAIQFRTFVLPQDITDAEIKKRTVLNKMRSETAAIRNWAYPAQIARTVSGIFNAIESPFKEAFGLESTPLIRALQRLITTTEVKLNQHLQRIRYVWQAKNHIDAWARYCQSFPDIKREPGEGKRLFHMLGGNEERFKVSMIFYSDLRLAQIFSFSVDEFAEWYGVNASHERLTEVLAQWSLAFGDLEDGNTEHFILDNPVLRKPFIKLEPVTFFCPVIGAIYHSLAGMMEHLLRSRNDEALLHTYERARSRYLEDETVRVLQTGIPSGQVFQGSKWRDPGSGVVYENDVLVILSSFVIVVECKSGLVDPPARRGAEYRLVDTLEDLVIAPATQANRFIDFLKAHPGMHEFETDRGTVNRIDNREVRAYVPLSVTLENLGTISANLKDSFEAGLIDALPSPLVPSICVTDLEMAVDLLNEMQLLHYVVRRAQLESELDYLADESDLLAFYLDTGFNISGSSQDGGPIAANLLLKSKELDPFFTARAAGHEVIKPRLRLTGWWRDLLDALVSRKPERWPEIGFALLNASKADQAKLENLTKDLLADVRRGRVKHEHNWNVLVTGTGNRAYAIVSYPYSMMDRDKRNDLLRYIGAETANQHDLLGIVLIGIKAEQPAYPYDVLAYVPREEVERIRADKKDP